MLRWIVLLAVLGATNGQSPGFVLHLLKHKTRYPVVQKIVTPQPTSNCICVPYYQCNSNNTIIVDGKGIIDVRFLAVTYRRCTGDLEVCCGLPPPSMAPIVIPTVPSTTTTTTPPPTTPPPTTPPPTTTTPTTTTTTTTEAPTTTPSTTTEMTTTEMPTTPTTTPTPSTTMRATQPVSMCVCVPTEQCDANGYVVVGGEGVINPRQTLNPCPVAGQVCCRFPTTPKPSAQPIVTPTYPVGQPVVCACVRTYQCDANGWIVISGTGDIDPRYQLARQRPVLVDCGGRCVTPIETCCGIYASGQNFPSGFPTIPGAVAPSYSGSGVIKNPGTARACVCVKSWQCAEGNVVNLDGAGILDPRFRLCPVADEICCRVQGITRFLTGSGEVSSGNGGYPNFVVNPNVPQPSTSAVCGVRRTACLSGQTCATKPGDASFAEFPWMVALFVRQPDGALIFQCGASIINAQSILTAAHCVIDRQSGALVARFGEWNTANNDEPAPYQEVDVQAVVTHPLYYSGGLYNDVAVLILAKPIAYAINVMPICLPNQAMTFAPGTQCVASGWGRSAFEGQYQTILRKVDLPIVDRTDCQTRLRSTRLGQYFQLHESFICAGGEPSKDTCRGDGGGPLACPTATGQWVQAGIVSWGIGCGESNTPAVYASVSQFRQWIDRQLANHGVL